MSTIIYFTAGKCRDMTSLTTDRKKSIQKGGGGLKSALRHLFLHLPLAASLDGEEGSQSGRDEFMLMIRSW
jgi:hypothetical protein